MVNKNIITKSTKYGSSGDRCPCCGSNNIFTWVAENQNKKKVQMVTCDSCKFECTSGYKYSRSDTEHYTYF